MIGFLNEYTCTRALWFGLPSGRLIYTSSESTDSGAISSSSHETQGAAPFGFQFSITHLIVWLIPTSPLDGLRDNGKRVFP